MKRILLTTLGILALALALGLPAAALVVATTQAQGVITQGLPARYIPAFTGAGIDTTALLGPYCKSASAAGGTLTITCEDDDDPTNPDAVTTFAGGGGGTNPQAVVGVAYNQATNTFTFTQAGGNTITCRTDADCPLPAYQTIYAATSATPTFVATDFTDPATGFSATGNPPLLMEFPSAVTGLDSTAWALPASLTLTGIAAYSNDNICRTYSPSTLDCATSTSITINGDAYHYYTYNDGRPGVVSPATLNWSE